MKLYRLAKTQYAAQKNLYEYGYGPSHYGSRWNTASDRVERRIVYASAHFATALLEVLAHVGDEALDEDWSLVTFELNEAYMQVLDTAVLDDDWDAYPYTTTTTSAGDEWCDEQASAVLRVPSAIINPSLRDLPENANFLINAQHPDAGEAVKIVDVVPHKIDPRLLVKERK